MRRREFITLLGGTAVAWPLTARAQQPAMPVVGFFRSTSRADSERLIVAFRQGLRLGGYNEGKDVAIEYRWADNHLDRQPALAIDLVSRKVDVIVANQGASAAVMATNKTIPFVFVVGGDPIKLGLVSSLSRPGGNVTGLSFLQDTVVTKQLELMRELVPRSSDIAMLMNPATRGSDIILNDAQETARKLGLKLHIANASNERDIDAAFQTFLQKQVGALVVPGDSLFNSRREQITGLAARHSIPAIYTDRGFAEAGGLMSYGPSQTDAYRQAGIYVSKILKGAKPADLPVERSVKFDLIVNLKAASALGIDMPLSLLIRVSDAIE
jgi:putative ABC transport system substrate-binding protein